MLQKCANPACVTRFRSLREGKLFLAQVRTPDLHKVHREHFWLCGVCSTHFTLRFDDVRGMVAIPLPESPSPDATSAD